MASLLSQEAQTRLVRFPAALLRLAQALIPREQRDERYREWVAEISYIARETDGLPVTRLIRGLAFAVGAIKAAARIRGAAWLRALRAAAGGPLVIAIDGPSGSGKSSASMGVARELGLAHLDTGTTYRALTWWLMCEGVDVTDSDAVAAALSGPRSPSIEVATDPDDRAVRIDDLDVSRQIYTPEVTKNVSAVAAVPAAREFLVAQQRLIVRQLSSSALGIVISGRDSGTVVAPDAALKVFLTADAATRAQRRLADLAGVPEAIAPANRGQHHGRPRSQQTGPDGYARLIDTTELTLDETVRQIAAGARNRRRKLHDVSRRGSCG
jgi:cytidylate kinase